MKAKALRISTLVVCAVLTQGLMPATAQVPDRDAGESRTTKIRKYLDMLRQKEAGTVKIPMPGTDRTNELREDLVRELAEEVLSLREENLALKREIEELKKKR